MTPTKWFKFPAVVATNWCHSVYPSHCWVI